MKFATLFLVSLLVFVGSAHARKNNDGPSAGRYLRMPASVKAITVTAKTVEGFLVEIKGYKSGSTILPMGGAGSLSLRNSQGGDIAQGVVLNSTFDKLLLDGDTNKYSIVVCLAERLEEIGGLDGFVKKLAELSGQKIKAPTKLAENYNFVMALIGADGKVTVDTATFQVRDR